MTAFRWVRMTSPMCGRRAFGACSVNAFSVEATESALSVNAIVTTLPAGDESDLRGIRRDVRELFLLQAADGCVRGVRRIRTGAAARGKRGDERKRDQAAHELDYRVEV